LKDLANYIFTLWLFSPLLFAVFVISLIVLIYFALTCKEEDFYRPEDV